MPQPTAHAFVASAAAPLRSSSLLPPAAPRPQSAAFAVAAPRRATLGQPGRGSGLSVPRMAAAAEATAVAQWFRPSPPPPAALRAATEIFGEGAVEVRYETCFNVGGLGSGDAGDVLEWLLAETFEPEGLMRRSEIGSGVGAVVEVGPRLNFQTAWSANAVSICKACGLKGVTRLERSRRYSLTKVGGGVLDTGAVGRFVEAVYDRMTEMEYVTPLRSFDSGMQPAATSTVPVMTRGRAALEEVNAEQGLGFDTYDIDLYMDLFVGTMQRDPTIVELFDLAQSNSEHSRHWFFKGKLIIDGDVAPTHLFDIVRQTLKANPRNSVIAFADNSSTIRGGAIPLLLPSEPGHPSPFRISERDRDVLFTAETHNFPTGVAPFPGAETGAGGRIRDTAATGTGSLVVAGTAGYSVGNLSVPGVDAPWEDKEFGYPENLRSPLRILIDASNGASDYGNKFGEPVINGFARSYGQRLPNGERREYVKPIMFSGGMGAMDHAHAEKGEASIGLWVVKIGGPAYRIGMGGGAASSMMQGDNKAELDFNAVQRGDAEMEQKAYRVLRTCVELGPDNPIVSLHDQGAGGNCNVVKELIYPAGAKIDLRKVWVGDSSLSALEIWGAEYQEQFGLLLRPESLPEFRAICARENVVPAFLGEIDGSGRIELWDEEADAAVVDLDLEAVLGDLPQKTFEDRRVAPALQPLDLPEPSSDTVLEALRRVLSLMTVGSKRFLTSKVDRSVTGLVAQQQCVGPLQIALANAGVLAQTMFDDSGSATAIGERPTLTALSPSAMARMTVGEMMTNLATVGLTAREDIKCEANWMWAAKLPGDGASLFDAAGPMRDIMIELGIAVDGGKDSLSMAARCPSPGDAADEVVRAPGTLVVTGYCTVADIARKLTPDLKSAGDSVVLHVDIASGRRRLGGSCLAQVYTQLGDDCPDVDNVAMLLAAFDAVQQLIKTSRFSELLSYHDVSDGGVLTALLEMAFAGNCGININLADASMAGLFAEELGMLLEVDAAEAEYVSGVFKKAGVRCETVATTRVDAVVTVNTDLLVSDVATLRDMWEHTAFALERLQANVETVVEEERGLASRTGPKYKVPWSPKPSAFGVNAAPSPVPLPKVAVVREEGSNGDREMTAAFHMSGFEAWDVSVRDISDGVVTLSDFRGAVFVGGFSYADVLDSAKGWAGVIRFNDTVRLEFEAFYKREDTFSLGICNGCQLMALLGRVPFSPTELENTEQPRFIHNKSGRFESRFTTVAIDEASPAIMLRGMGGAHLGVWSAHGEGRAYFPDTSVLKRVIASNLAPLHYVDDDGLKTTAYPFNPNGSENGIAALCTPDGRHLAMMPHPERTIMKWQWGYMPTELDNTLEASPWLTMFQNARRWCDEH